MSKNELNPFSETDESSVMAEVESDRAMHEVQSAMIIAKKFPRDQRAAMDRILNACTREKLANQAIYVFPRGKEQIEGPSIRLAEVIAQNWGNLNYGILELEQRLGSSTCQAYSWDLETNTRKSINFHVEHIRYSKKFGNTKLVDPRDIYEMVSNQGSRRVRNCILALIPGDVVDGAVNQCKITQQDKTPVTEQIIKDTIKAFKKFGVTEEMLATKIGHAMKGIKSPQLLYLRRIYQSLKDGIGNAGAYFEVAEGSTIKAPESKSDAKKSKTKTKTKTKKTPKETTDTKDDGPSDDDIFSMIDNASDIDDITVIQDLIRDYPEDKLEFYNELVSNKIKELGK